MAAKESAWRANIPSSREIQAAKTQLDDLKKDLAAHGRTGLTHAVTGSVAERVLQRAACAVLTVREAAPAPVQKGATTVAGFVLI
jgi:hypothetical protein